MRKWNLYYVISTVTLVFMAFIMIRTLQVRGWFTDLTPLEQVEEQLPGSYRWVTQEGGETDSLADLVSVLPDTTGKHTWFCQLDSGLAYRVELSDFEDDQVLAVIYKSDSSHGFSRLEGCELLLVCDTDDTIRGRTVGTFCGLQDTLSAYLVLQLDAAATGGRFKIETRDMDDETLLRTRRYSLERMIP